MFTFVNGRFFAKNSVRLYCKRIKLNDREEIDIIREKYNIQVNDLYEYNQTKFKECKQIFKNYPSYMDCIINCKN